MAFVATLLLAAQSAFYSPAKYGLINDTMPNNSVAFDYAVIALKITAG
jgi:hypothetical protein